MSNPNPMIVVDPEVSEINELLEHIDAAVTIVSRIRERLRSQIFANLLSKECYASRRRERTAFEATMSATDLRQHVLRLVDSGDFKIRATGKLDV